PDALDVLNSLELPLAEEITSIEGEIQSLTPTIDALYVPDIDGSLDEVGTKQQFWSAFRALGGWYDQLPPY
ncbi:MAG: uracil-DNA glycosylase family protein, partial [Solirubrobacterales bacterium]